MIMLVLGPILMAVTNILLRYMRSLHEYTASMYSVLTSVIVFSILIPSTGQEVTMMRTFTFSEFVILTFVSLAGGLGMLLKTKSF
jgi:hypothetical protein